MSIRILQAAFCLTLLAVLSASSFSKPHGVSPAYDDRAALSRALQALKQQLEAGSAGAVNEFWKKIETAGAPLVEADQNQPGYSILTFVYRGTDGLKAVRLDSPVNALLINGVEPNLERLGMMNRLLDTNVWYLSVRVRNDLRTTYRFFPQHSVSAQAAQEEKPQLDPFNSRVFARGVEGQELSLIELPDAPAQPWVKEDAASPKGTWDTLKFKSRVLGNEKTVWVYKPAGYDVKRRRPLGFVLCFGGLEFGSIIPTRVIMDNLIAAGKIPPTLVILVDNVDAKSEQARYASTIRFLAGELLPQLRKQYNLTTEPDKAVIAGTSRRGLVAAIVGFNRPEIFGGVLSMSGAFFWRPGKDAEYEWLATQFAANPVRRLKLYLTVGLLETVVTPGNSGHYMLAANRHMRNVLEAKGYRFKMAEYYGGHEDFNWQGGFADGLIYLLGQKGYRSNR